MLSRKKLKIFNAKRLEILERMQHSKGGLCGCDVVDALGISKNLASYHIKILKDFGVLDVERKGKFVFYSINEKFKEDIKCILKFLSEDS